MTVRIYTPQPLKQGISVTLDPDSAHHLSTVLRKRPGFEFNLFNGDGSEFGARICRCQKKSVVIEVVKQLHCEPEPDLKLNLFIAISKGERMDFALQKAVELGISSVTPIISERTVVRLSAERLNKRESHWRKIIISASEQSGRCRIPELNPSQQIDHLISNPAPGKSFLLDHRSRHSFDQLTAPQDNLNLIIGPEGGLSESEQESLVNAGCVAVRLGPRVLRTETAPLAALAVIQALWGDFRGVET